MVTTGLRWGWAVLGTLLLSLPLAGCSSSSGPTTTDSGTPPQDSGGGNDTGPPGDSGSTSTVTVGGSALAFSPQSLTIKAGQSVHWVWMSGGHTVTSGMVSGGTGTPDNKFCSPNDMSCATGTTSNSGATYDHTFATAGTYPYFCVPHAGAGMVGTIIVQ
jgi:plastocyanin